MTLRKRILAMIEEQAEAGPSGRIVLKLNGLTDAAMIDAVYRASGAGVEIDLAVRGLCRLRPGIPDSPSAFGSVPLWGISWSIRGSTASVAPPPTRRPGPACP